MNRRPRILAVRGVNDDLNWGNETYPIAAFICAMGFFMRLLLSEPVLNILGIHYGSEDAGLLGKIHPGSYLIILSFVVLLASRRNPFEQLIRIAREQPAFFGLFAVYVTIAIYWVIRGPKGIGMIFDTHIALPICAIVFSYAPRTWYRKIVYAFAGIVVLNSLIGIFESSTHIRIFPFNPDWEVLAQDYFRASALMGHPLANAAFTAVSMFIVMNIRMPAALKSVLLLVIMCSLVGFGGRAALGIAVAGLAVLGAIEAKKYFGTGQLTVMRLLIVVLAVIIVPAICGGLLYGVLHSGMGDRLMAYNSLEDDSAEVRMMSVRALGYMSPEDVIFGMDGDHILSVIERSGMEAPTSDIENPWILMFMFLGGIMFSLWAAAMIAFFLRLMRGASPALKIAIVEYFVIASTSNSFGRKDMVFVIIGGIIVCAKRLQEMEQIAEPGNLSLTDSALD